MSESGHALPAVAFIGAGAMGGAIVAGLVASGIPVRGGIRVVNRSEAKAASLRGPGVLSLAYETVDDATAQVLRGAKLVVLGVKPAAIPGLLAEVQPLLETDAVVVSIAAGVTTARMEALVPNPVVRAMPNTPATIRLGVTGVAAGSRVTEDAVASVVRLFESVGSVVVVPESRIDALTAISGSGPAYVYLLVEALTEAARRLGFADAEARALAEGTFGGAAALLGDSGEAPAELRRQVTSPGGTTERAIAVLSDAGLADLFTRAAEAAIARAAEMSAD